MRVGRSATRYASPATLATLIANGHAGKQCYLELQIVSVKDPGFELILGEALRGDKYWYNNLWQFLISFWRQVY